jgi:hypothetical protein
VVDEVVVDEVVVDEVVVGEHVGVTVTVSIEVVPGIYVVAYNPKSVFWSL